jgi:hypothetical protein
VLYVEAFGKGLRAAEGLRGQGQGAGRGITHVSSFYCPGAPVYRYHGATTQEDS